MNNPKGLIVVLIVVAAPIIWFCIRVNSINKEYASGDLSGIKTEIENISNEYISQVDPGENIQVDNSVSGDSEGGSKYGNPISKLIENAKINATSVNVYQEPDETSSLVGAVYKDMAVTVQDYPNGWSLIKYGEGSGWVKSENVTRPEDNTQTGTSLISAVGKKGKVLVDVLNVRASAVDGEVLETIHINDEFNIIGANEDESWFQIQYGTKSGWVSGSSSLVQVIY